jgi:DNA-binding CsgD family transcriptional regulator
VTSTPQIDWQSAKHNLGQLTDEEQRILDLLADGKSQAEIAKALGQHRSKIWRRVRSLRKRVAA